MRSEPVLIGHNYYQQPGGEDGVYRAESRLLAGRGHSVIPYTVHNDSIGTGSGFRVAASAVWSNAAYRELRAIFQQHRPAVAHFHNTFPLLSPSAYYAARADKIPVVQTLHNFRLSCPNALFFRQGHVCQSCLGKAVPWPGVVHRCYRASASASGVVAGMLVAHRLLGTYRNAVDVYVALSRFARDKFVEAGLPGDRIVVKPNFLYPEPAAGGHGGGYALFVGRLAPEKGLITLLEAWQAIGSRCMLKVVGRGPEERLLQPEPPGVEWLGWRGQDEVTALMQEAAFLVMPSLWYENFPMTLLEAYATGLPVIGSAIGSLAELIEDRCTGRLFQPGDADDLATVLAWALAHPRELAELGRRARHEFDLKYTAETNYDQLLSIYRVAGEHARAR